MESLVIESLNVGGNGSYQGYPENQRHQDYYFFDITVLTLNTGKCPNSRSSDANDHNGGSTWNYWAWDGLRGKY